MRIGTKRLKCGIEKLPKPHRIYVVDLKKNCAYACKALGWDVRHLLSFWHSLRHWRLSEQADTVPTHKELKIKQ